MTVLKSTFLINRGITNRHCFTCSFKNKQSLHCSFMLLHILCCTIVPSSLLRLPHTAVSTLVVVLLHFTYISLQTLHCCVFPFSHSHCCVRILYLCTYACFPSSQREKISPRCCVLPFTHYNHTSVVSHLHFRCNQHTQCTYIYCCKENFLLHVLLPITFHFFNNKKKLHAAAFLIFTLLCVFSTCSPTTKTRLTLPFSFLYEKISLHSQTLDIYALLRFALFSFSSHCFALSLPIQKNSICFVLHSL